jgi:hypothetical protein
MISFVTYFLYISTLSCSIKGMLTYKSQEMNGKSVTNPALFLIVHLYYCAYANGLLLSLGPDFVYSQRYRVAVVVVIINRRGPTAQHGLCSTFTKYKRRQDDNMQDLRFSQG